MNGQPMKRLGIVGGLGPETSCKFCLAINNKFRDKTSCQPDIVLENLPVSLDAEQKIVSGELSSEMQSLLIRAVRSLNKAGADMIVIPCNTVHVFIDILRKESQAPILSIIEECAAECEKQSFRKVGLLASTTTVNSCLHSRELGKRRIEVVLPEDRDQRAISSIILKIIHGTAGKEDKKILKRIIREMAENCAQAVILGCTDLPLFITEKESVLPLISTTAILEDATVRELCILPDCCPTTPLTHGTLASADSNAK